MKTNLSANEDEASAPLSHRITLPPELIVSWLRTRMLLWKIMALWGLVLLSVLLATPALFSNLERLSYTATLALMLITVFRLWDDVADIEFDQQHHKERVLVQYATHGTPAALYCLTVLGLLLTGSLLYLFHSWTAALGLALLTLFMLVIYTMLPALTPHRTLRNTLVLLKYPAMLILLSGGQISIISLLIAAVLYALLVIYETYTA